MNGINNLRFYVLLSFFALSCTRPDNRVVAYTPGDTPRHQFAEGVIDSDALVGYASNVTAVNSALSDSIVLFAKTLIGTPYKFGCEAPSTGFDCSGFINYVFQHFHITVPRSSIEFTDLGTTIAREGAKPGDIILFTGTNNRIRTVGHVGIVVTNDKGNITFIQSTSGKEFSVTISPLDDYYLARFVKVIRILK